MHDWKGLETPLEETLLERLLDKLAHVQQFKVSGMGFLPEAVRTQLVEFAAIVLEQQKSFMHCMDFSANICTKELTAFDERLVEAICNSNETKLSQLALGCNTSWWKN